MQITSAIIFAISANIDCLAIGLSYGLKEVHIDKKTNAFIALLSSIGTGISMMAGSAISYVISPKLTNQMGCAILIVIGLVMLLQAIQETYCHKKTKNLTDYDVDASGTINGKEVVALSIGLMLNNMGLGIGASITGTPILLSCFLTFILSQVFIGSSQYLGKTYASKYVGHMASFISGILILLMGFFELFS